LHDREQLRANDLFIGVNKPLYIDSTLVGRWISISWFRKLDPDSIHGFYAFDLGYISSIVENLVQIHFAEVAKSYYVPLKSSNWTKCVEVPPSRQYQWQLLSNKASLLFLCVVQRNCLNFISFLQCDIILQHEINQLNEYDLIVDAMKTSLDNSLIGRWTCISWHRQTETLDFFAFDVGMVTDVKEVKVFIDYKDEGVHAIPLKASGWNCFTNDIPKRQHRWRMLAKKYTKTEATNKSMGI
jgi:hypothetical protein